MDLQNIRQKVASKYRSPYGSTAGRTSEMLADIALLVDGYSRAIEKLRGKCSCCVNFSSTYMEGKCVRCIHSGSIASWYAPAGSQDDNWMYDEMGDKT